MNFTLYPWQSECLELWSAGGSRGLVNVVTGAGKTILALAAADMLKKRLSEPLRVKIIVPTTFLLSQWRNSLLHSDKTACCTRDEIGYYYGERKDSSDHSYMIYVINSARYALARHIMKDLKEGCSVLLIADECHHYTSPENRRIFDFLPFLGHMPGSYYCLGLSATPDTSEFSSFLLPALGPEIYRYDFSDAVRKHTVTPFAIFQIAVSLDNEELENYELLSDQITHTLRKLTVRFPALKNLSSIQFFKALRGLSHSTDPVTSSLAEKALALTYKRTSLTCNARSRISCALKLIESLNSATKIIIFGERIQQADEVYRLLAHRFPGQAERCHSKIDKQAQKNAVERYLRGENRILVTCRSMDEGFNIPEADVGIVLSSTSAQRQRIQRLGRILRYHEGKDIASLYYLHLDTAMEQTDFLSLMPDHSLDFHLSYDQESDEFSFPDYEKAAISVLDQFRKTSTDTAFLKETLKCLQSGMLRPDWLLANVAGEDVWEEKLQQARTLKEKNYWICMKYVWKACHRNNASI